MYKVCLTVIRTTSLDDPVAETIVSLEWEMMEDIVREDANDQLTKEGNNHGCRIRLPDNNRNTR